MEDNKRNDNQVHKNTREEEIKKQLEQAKKDRANGKISQSKKSAMRRKQRLERKRKKKETIPFIKPVKEGSGVLSYIAYGIKWLGCLITGMLGVLGNLIGAIIWVLFSCLIVTFIVGCIIYGKVRPEFKQCRERAYDVLAQMKRSDFSMLSDTEIYDKDGKLIGLINAGHYEYVPITEISMHIQNGYIAQEDKRFKEHSGIDYMSILRAGLALVKHEGEITQGGSTITQQVVKNTFLTQDKTFTRKITEILLAPEVEKKYSKADIMEFYCNTNFYGNRCYGVQAASRYYFGKDAKDLEVWESAMLVGLSNSPSQYDPIKHPEEALVKRNRVLENMHEAGFLEKEKMILAQNQALSIVQEQQEGTEENYQSSYAIHCAALELMKNDGFDFKYTFSDADDYNTYKQRYNDDYNEASETIRAGGFRIKTSLDSNIQERLQLQIDEALKKSLEQQENGKFALQGAAVVVDNNTNYVVAIVGGRGTEDQFNRGYLSARQPGSAIKPLIDYGPAFDTGEYYPSKVMNDHKWEDGPKNSGGNYRGDITIREALNRSINTVAWQVLQGIGVDKGLSYLDKMHFLNLSYIDNGVESLSIGGFTNGARVVDMAKGYATLANNGVYSDKTCITSIYHEQQGELYKSSEKLNQVYTVDTAYMLTDVLKGTFSDIGTGRGLDLGGIPAAGKTGTTNSNKDTWFCGYTKYYTTAVWVGYDTPRAMPGVFGATYAGKIWNRFMLDIHQGLELLDWEQPETVTLENYDSSGNRANHDTGMQDLFSQTAELEAKQREFERQQKKYSDSVEQKLLEFENWDINTIEDTYLLTDKYTDIQNQIAKIADDEIRNAYLNRASDRYITLKSIINGMSDAIKEYENSKLEESKAAQEEESRVAEENRKNLEKSSRIKKFTDKLKLVTELKYKQDNMKGLIEEATTELKNLVDLDEYDSLLQDLNNAIKGTESLPSKEEWARLEEERKVRESEEARRVEESKRALEESRQNELDKIQNNLKETQPSGYGPGYGPGYSSEPEQAGPEENSGPNSIKSKTYYAPAETLPASNE